MDKRLVLMSLLTAVFISLVAWGKPAYATDPVPDVKVEVVLLMGQSGMVGLDTTAPVMPFDNRIWFWAGPLGYSWWSPGREPLHGFGYGPGMDFAKHLLVIRPNVHSIMLIPCAVNGSMTERWVPGGDLYERCLGLVHESGLRPTGALVYQGGSDTFVLSDADAWATRFTSMVTGLRAEYGTIPVVYGQLGNPPSPPAEGVYPHWNRVQDAQAALSMYGVKMVPTADLSRMPDGLHFIWYSAIPFGQRLAQAYSNIRDGV